VAGIVTVDELPTCDVCGAVVPPKEAERHRRWHAGMDRPRPPGLPPPYQPRGPGVRPGAPGTRRLPPGRR
jgi:hypothetical protein